MAEVNPVIHSQYPDIERWLYRGRLISIHRKPANDGVLHALSLGIPMDSLHIYYSVLVYNGPSPESFAYMTVPDVEIEDYAIRKELIESWIEANLPRHSFTQRLAARFHWIKFLSFLGKHY